MSKVFHHFLLPILGFTGAVLWLTWYRFQSAARGGSDLRTEDALHLLSAGAYSFLLAGSLGLRRALALLKKQPIRPLPLRSIILFAFLLPFLVSLIPIAVLNLPYIPGLWLPLDLFFSLRIWLPALQMLSLAILLLLGEQFQPARFKIGPSDRTFWTAVLCGLGLWLVAMYSYQLGILIDPGDLNQGAAVLLASPTRLGLSALLVLGLPILEGLYFRGRLLPEMQQRLGSFRAILVCAGLGAVLSIQPLLWIPAFLAGIGFNFLASRPGGLRTSIYAHTVFNILALLVIPGLIL